MDELDIKPDNLKILKKIMSRVSMHNLHEQKQSVDHILTKVKNEGNQALKEFSAKFDKYTLGDSELSGINAEGYFSRSDESLKEALNEAKSRIEHFHQQEYINSNFETGWRFKGQLNESLGVRYQALESVAVYIPGGQAPLLSTLLMTVIPAQVAGVKRIVMFSPPPIHPNVLATADLLGIKEIYPIGGAQAVAAAAYGTESINAVSKIVGPGNIYVSLAKKEVFGTIGIDGIYGPSELAIVADETANPELIALDLLSQLEHGSGLESVLFLTSSDQVLSATKAALEDEFNNMKNFKTEQQIKTIKSSLDNYSALLKVENMNEAANLINIYAPEHLELQANEDKLKILLDKIKYAGAIFIGESSCESLGDYIAGPSHCLPTGGSAKFSSGLQAHDFMIKSSLVDFRKVAKSKFTKLAQQASVMARAESLEYHALAMDERLKD
jgi:histidinol dehydrogenase